MSKKKIFLFIIGTILLNAYSGEFKCTTARLWHQETRGHNLAAGKAFEYSILPGYHLTKSDADPYELTDGKLSSHSKDKIWFDRNAVGWHTNEVPAGLNLLMDLGKVENIGKAVIRLLGGAEQRGLIFPKSVAVYISKDGRNYYPTGCLQKLMPGEKDQSDFKQCFFLPEDGTAYVYPFTINVQAAARYVIIRIHGASSAVFSDEVVILEGSPAVPGFNHAYRNVPEQLPMKGIVAKPNSGRFVIPRNLSAPNSFFISDMRNPKNKNAKAELVIEVPPEIILETPSATLESSIKNGRKINRYKVPLKKLGNRSQTDMFYFKATGKTAPGAMAALYVECADEPVWPQSYPLEILEFPEIEHPLDGLPIDLSWMGVSDQQRWPGFLGNWKKFGFDAVTCFPRYYPTPQKRKQLADYLKKAREKGYKVVVNESPFHLMGKKYADKKEIYTQLANGTNNRNLCPSYTGEYYRKELERIEDNVHLTVPDRIYWDIECWYDGALDAIHGRCIRCTELQKKSGLDMEHYLRQCGVRMLRDLKEAVRKGMAGRRLPVIGSYNHHASPAPHHYLFSGLDSYPEFIDQMQPSLYVAGRTELVHQVMRENYEAVGARRIFPWLSTGTYGEFPSYKLEQMIYEVLLNGGDGFGYYWFGDFDTPLDYYYHVKALATIAPYWEILKNGSPWFRSGSNKGLFYSGWTNSDRALLLVGNYLNATEETTIELPFLAKTIRDIRSGREYSPAKTLKLNVPKDQVCLLYLKK